MKLVALAENLGFGGGSNAGFRAAANDIVVLLNSDMRVAADFLAPLLDGFGDPLVFAVSCQIFFSDPASCAKKPASRKAGGRTAACACATASTRRSTDLFPCFYGGGGSCAFDRAKFLELGGFDPLLAPFYLEDTDLGYHGLEARLESALPTAQRGLSRASRHHRQALQRRAYPGRSEEKLPAVLLEEHPRVARGWRRISSSPGPAR